MFILLHRKWTWIWWKWRCLRKWLPGLRKCHSRYVFFFVYRTQGPKTLKFCRRSGAESLQHLTVPRKVSMLVYGKPFGTVIPKAENGKKLCSHLSRILWEYQHRLHNCKCVMQQQQQWLHFLNLSRQKMVLKSKQDGGCLLWGVAPEEAGKMNTYGRMRFPVYSDKRSKNLSGSPCGIYGLARVVPRTCPRKVRYRGATWC